MEINMLLIIMHKMILFQWRILTVKMVRSMRETVQMSATPSCRRIQLMTQVVNIRHRTTVTVDTTHSLAHITNSSLVETAQQYIGYLKK